MFNKIRILIVIVAVAGAFITAKPVQAFDPLRDFRRELENAKKLLPKIPTPVVRPADPSRFNMPTQPRNPLPLQPVPQPPKKSLYEAVLEQRARDAQDQATRSELLRQADAKKQSELQVEAKRQTELLQQQMLQQNSQLLQIQQQQQAQLEAQQRTAAVQTAMRFQRQPEVQQLQASMQMLNRMKQPNLIRPVVQYELRIDSRSGAIMQGEFVNGQFTRELPIGQAMLLTDQFSGRVGWVAPAGYPVSPVLAE